MTKTTFERWTALIAFEAMVVWGAWLAVPMMTQFIDRWRRPEAVYATQDMIDCDRRLATAREIADQRGQQIMEMQSKASKESRAMYGFSPSNCEEITRPDSKIRSYDCTKVSWQSDMKGSSKK
jgi:hypothetical protein